MSNEPSPGPRSTSDPRITVPRGRNTDPKIAGRGETAPQPGKANIRDEDYAEQGKPLLPDSPTARALQERPPQGKEQLRTGTAGDAGRPTKEGLHDKPIPPRGRL